MKIKRTASNSKSKVTANEMISDNIAVDATPDTIVVEADSIEEARSYIQAAIDCLCEIASTNNKAQAAIVDLGVISLDLSK